MKYQNKITMKLTKKEKSKIFWALLEKFPEHERGRKQAKEMFSDKPEKLSESLKVIDKNEEDAYALIERFSDELGMDMPKRPGSRPLHFVVK